MDQRTKRYPTYQDVLRYCEHSATPVGRMVLHVFGYRDEERGKLSDATCIALQLANFWQDVQRDLAMGRIYIPLEDMARYGYSEADLQKRLVNESFRTLMAFEVDRARGLFQEGLKLVDKVDGELRLDLRLFSVGGLSVLDAIKRRNYDVLSARPTVGKAKKIQLMLTGFAQLGAVKLTGRRRDG
jgi:squalene synthase HpnC